MEAIRLIATESAGPNALARQDIKHLYTYEEFDTVMHSPSGKVEVSPQDVQKLLRTDAT